LLARLVKFVDGNRYPSTTTCTARLTIVESTCCRSSVELTALADFGKGAQLTDGVGELIGTVLQFLEQANVFYGDDSLIGKKSSPARFPCE